LSARILLALLLLLSGGCASASLPDPSAAEPAAVERIKMGVSALRGLEFKSDVPVEVKSRAEMLRAFEDDIADEYGEEGLAQKALAYGKLGLIPEKVDLKKALLEFYGAEVVAFYDPRTKKLVMPDRAAGAGEDMPLVLAHELTHALQDQHFPVLEKLIHASDDDGDLALRAVVEGDATLAGYSYAGAGRRALFELARKFEEEMRQSMPSFGGVPEALVEEMLFPYYGGAALVARALEERGWAGVDALYAAPPLSTEQVLHPEKYFTAPDPPSDVVLGGLAAAFPDDWKELENNVLGELMTRVLFERFLPKEDARIAAEGWDGDRFIAYARGDAVAFVWASVWDSERDAEEFLGGYRRVLAKKYPSAAARQAYAERRGLKVLIAEGLEGERAGASIESLWQSIDTKKQPFTPPFPPSPTAPAAEPVSP
jgi:hypothetical protein